MIIENPNKLIGKVVRITVRTGLTSKCHYHVRVEEATREYIKGRYFLEKGSFGVHDASKFDINSIEVIKETSKKILEPF